MNGIEKVLYLLEDTLFSRILYSVIVILILWLFNRIIVSIVDKRITDVKSRYSWKKTISYIFVFLGFILVGRLWFEGIQSLATFLGLLSAGLAIALKDLVANFAGWIFIVWRKPFQVGNRIQIGENAGDVIDLRPFQFTILEIGNWVKADQSTGRMIHIPNGLIFAQPLCNYDHGFKYIWHEIPVLITFESAWKKAKNIMQKIADDNALQLSSEAEEEIKKTARKFLIFYNVLTPKVYTSVEDSGVLLTIRYLTEIRKRRGTSEAIWEDILQEFAKHDDINLAYPTIRRVDK
ncbi:MAG: mechanosensitive ion channel family protein [Candidatus Cloacimonetes bacterium]|nr:mechanosensitive ion channel family protein [Candidatus Cloacimonadota bacterium]